MQFEIDADDADDASEPVAPGTSSCYPGGGWNYPECCQTGDYMC